MNLGSISKNRSSIYGNTMLWIMLYHSSFLFSAPWMRPLSIMKNMGDCGVDVFLLLSGISLYFSLSNKGSSLKGFYIRRLKRIMFPVLLTSMVWFTMLAIYRGTNTIAFLLDVTGISFFVTGNRTVWFVTMIIICYAIYPLLYSVNKRTGNSIWALAIMLLICFTLNLTLRNSFPLFWKNSEILFRRMPIFIIGAFCGKYVYEKRSLPFSVKQGAAASVTIIAIYILTKKYWSPVIPVHYAYIILSISCTMLFSIIGNVSAINRITSWFSPITFEVYLCHEKWLSILTLLFPTIGRVAINIASIILCIFTAKLLVFLENGAYHKLASCIKITD